MSDEETKWMKEREGYVYALWILSCICAALITGEICRLAGWSRDWTWNEWAMTLIGSVIIASAAIMGRRVRNSRRRPS